MRWYEIKKILENSTAGSTGSGNIATVSLQLNNTPDSFGSGFDEDGDWGIYSFKKKENNNLIKRIR